MTLESSTHAAQVFRLPDLGEGLTEAGLVQWLVAVGDRIVTDQPIAEVETAKSIVELPSPFAGVVAALHGTPGDTIDVGAAVLEVRASDAAAPRGAADTERAAYRAEERAGSGNVLIGYGTREGSARGRRRRPAVPPTRQHHPAPTPADAVADVASTSSVPSRSRDATARPVAVRSPLVRRLARDLGLDVHAIVATGTDGAITRADVLRAAVDSAVDSAGAGGDAAASPVVSTGATTAEQIDGLTIVSRERLSPLRRAVGAKLSRSRAEIPEATVWVDVDLTELWNARGRMASEGEKAPSITSLLARFVLIALEEHAVLASRLSSDGAELISFDGVNLGIATDTARGLMVPVIPSAQALTVSGLDLALRDLTAAARAGTLAPERLGGSTFTLNNYGGLGVDGSAAIINHPDVAILGVGRILERAWVIDGAIVPRRIAQLSLVFDHRVCDGGYAASFLRRVTELIEHPLRAFGRV